MSREPLKPPGRGASHSKTRIGDRLGAWWMHHKASASGSAQRLWAVPWQTMMTALVVAIALALPATLLVALNNLQNLGERWDTNPKLLVYLDQRAQSQALNALQDRLRAWETVAQVDYISPDRALRDFQAQSGFGDVFSGLEENPLPPTLIITPTAEAISPEALQTLAERLEGEALVDEVSADIEWVRRMQQFMELGRQIVLALASLLSLGVLLVIGNTIRLAIENRREEIVVTKLVGGTDGFVRRPFLYTGLWYGFLGGVLSCILVSAGLLSISAPVSNLAAAYQSDYRLAGLGLNGALSLLLISCVLGLLGAWLAVSRHLQDVQPK